MNYDNGPNLNSMSCKLLWNICKQIQNIDNRRCPIYYAWITLFWWFYTSIDFLLNWCSVNLLKITDSICIIMFLCLWDKPKDIISMFNSHKCWGAMRVAFSHLLTQTYRCYGHIYGMSNILMGCISTGVIYQWVLIYM